MYVTSTDREYRKYFHIDQNSFAIALEYLRIEHFFKISRRGSGRPVVVDEEAVLMALVSYYATTLS